MSYPLTCTSSFEPGDAGTCSSLTELVLLAIRFNLDGVVCVECQAGNVRLKPVRVRYL